MPTANPVCLNGRKIVLYCGVGVIKALVDQGMQPRDLSLIVFSHLHSDHYLELGALLHAAWTAGLKTRGDIYGPAGIDDYWHDFLGSMKADIDLRIADEGRPERRNLVAIHVVDDGIVTGRNGITVSAIRTEHPPLADCSAFSFKTAKVHVVFSGDTAPTDKFADFAQDADLLSNEIVQNHC